MADEDDFAPLQRVDLGLAMHFGDERAGGIDWKRWRACAAAGTALATPWREDHRLPGLRNFVELLDEDGAFAFKHRRHGGCGHLVAHIDGGAVTFQGKLDDVDRPFDAGAKAAREQRRMSRVGLASGASN